MYILCPTSLGISVRDSKSQHFCGDTTSVRTLCTSPVFLMVNMGTIWSCVTERVYCAYLFVSFQHIFLTFVDSLCVHARVLRDAISLHSESKASLGVRNMTVGNFRNIIRPVTSQGLPLLTLLVSRPELVPWLQEQIVEQKRIDAGTSGTTTLPPEHSHGLARSKSSGPIPDVQLVLPGDARKQRKQTKQIYLEKGEIACRLGDCSSHTYLLSTLPQRSKWVYGSPLPFNLESQ
jgi:hypothetical protein